MCTMRTMGFALPFLPSMYFSPFLLFPTLTLVFVSAHTPLQHLFTEVARSTCQLCLVSM